MEKPCKCPKIQNPKIKMTQNKVSNAKLGPNIEHMILFTVPIIPPQFYFKFSLIFHFLTLFFLLIFTVKSEFSSILQELDKCIHIFFIFHLILPSRLIISKFLSLKISYIHITVHILFSLVTSASIIFLRN